MQSAAKPRDHKKQACNSSANEVKDHVIHVKKSNAKDQLKHLYVKDHSNEKQKASPKRRQPPSKTRKIATHREEKNEVAQKVPNNNVQVDTVCTQSLQIPYDGPERNPIGMPDKFSKAYVKRMSTIQKQELDENR